LRIGSFPLLWEKLVGEPDGKRKLESGTETAEQIQPARVAVPPRKKNRRNQDETVLCERFVTHAQKHKNVPDASQQLEN
jgi:hypothetical protein